MNQQEVFDKAAVHLLKQGKKSLQKFSSKGFPSCAYRGEDGKKCAIGALIPEEQYDERMERMSVTVLLQQEYAPACLKDMNKDFLQELQDCHDNASDVESEDKDMTEVFRSNLSDMAARWKLNDEVLCVS